MNDRSPAAGPFAAIFRILLAVGVIVLPLWYSPSGHDVYRLPKLLLFRGLGLALAGIWVAGALLLPSRTPRPRIGRLESWLVAVIAGWTVLTTLTSTDRLFSIDSLLTVVAAIAIFLAATAVLPGQPLRWTLAIVAVPAVANALVIAWQALHEKAVLSGEMIHKVRMHLHGMLGNANDAASFLAIPLIALIVYATLTRGIERLAAIAAVAVVTTAIVITSTLATIIACLAGVVTMVIVSRRSRVLAIAAITAVVAFALALAAYAPLRARLETARNVIAKGDYESLLSGRLIAFATAEAMILRHPLVGVGPGCFELQYMGHQQEALKRHRSLKTSINRGVNFGEAHNETLQYAAETGIVGGIVFLLSLVALARRGSDSTPFVHRLAAPLAVTVFFSSLAQFPFRLAAPTMICLYLAALCVSESS